MRAPLMSLGVLALFGVGLTVPASAQMCSPGQQVQSSTPAAGGMMCGGAMGAAVDDPMADKPAQTPQASGMCACCKNMAMMKGGMMGGQKDMPGMQVPK